VTITLEAPDTVHAGEPITGAIRSGQRVRVFVRRTTRWHGDARYANPLSKRDDAGVVVNGDAPFVLPMLRGPLTHEGERVELRWAVIAESLDGPSDRVEHAFRLVAPSATTYEREAAGGYRDRPTETTTLEPDLGERFTPGRPRRKPGPGADDTFTVFGMAVYRFFTSLTAPRAGVKDVTLDVTPSHVRAGDALVANLAFTTSEEVVVESIAIQLSAREHFGSSLRTEPYFDSHVETITERARLAPGPHTYEARFTVPPGAAPSFETESVGVEWFVRATIEIDGLPDAVGDFVIGVAPF
jgi:hypothetical protein